MNKLTLGKLVQFLRKRDYSFVKELGSGSCGETILLHDEIIDSYFVCKKYNPIIESSREELYQNFLREIKLLHGVYHPNVVRVFNYYLYPEHHAGYILMEYIEGQHIEEFIESNPNRIDEVFRQVVDGFAYLSEANILHRDIRPQNIIIRNDGTAKIIDLGFGKKAIEKEDFDKSISLNWWCAPPSDFVTETYDFSTEVYFVGKLFEQIIENNKIENFSYTEILSKMCSFKQQDRIQSFRLVRNSLLESSSKTITFDDEEKYAYKTFSESIIASLVKIEESAVYVKDLERIKADLDEIFQSSILEGAIYNPATLLRKLIRGDYYYIKEKKISASTIEMFLKLLKNCSNEKQNIILSNLQVRLDGVKRYKNALPTMDDDIPF